MKIDPFNGQPVEVIKFLQEVKNDNHFKFGTFNTYRSALSLVLQCDLGSNILVKRFLKGIKRLRPPQAKYHSTWNPDQVINYFKQLPNNNELSLKILTFKTATLLALISAQRVQTLSLIRLCNIFRKDNGYEIKITDEIKTSQVHSYQPLIKIPFFPGLQQVCVASTLESYLRATQSFRGEDQESLFVTFKKPFRTASTQTISRWIKTTLNLAGIDTNVFKTHSTRHAATSAALRKIVSVDTIRKTAGWSDASSTFFVFYNRPLQDDNFAESILLS